MTDNGKPHTTTDLELKRLDAAAKYPGVWKHVIAEWNSDLTGNSAWLTYSANYLLHTAGVRWAIDPFSMSTRVTGIPVPDFAQDMQKLELVVLTHAHNDHLDLNLIRAIASLPIKWVIPEDMVDHILGKTTLNRSQIIIPKPGGMIYFKNLSLTPFASLHFHARGGVKETGYLANIMQKNWLFPGDIRDFDPTRLPAFGSIDGVFAHLWLGKACALKEEPPYLDEFCNFFNRFSPKRIIVTHLNEFGRDETELWDETHFDRVKQRLAEVAPLVKVEMAVMGSKVTLS
jgi:L-ascorbate metabolism protein UlaG (beta-lactamase superfamily)